MLVFCGAGGGGPSGAGGVEAAGGAVGATFCAAGGGAAGWGAGVAAAGVAVAGTAGGATLVGGGAGVCAEAARVKRPMKRTEEPNSVRERRVMTRGALARPAFIRRVEVRMRRRIFAWAGDCGSICVSA